MSSHTLTEFESTLDELDVAVSHATPDEFQNYVETVVEGPPSASL